MTSKKGEKPKAVSFLEAKLFQSFEYYKWFHRYYASLICHMGN